MPLAEYCYAYSWWRLLDYLIDAAFLFFADSYIAYLLSLAYENIEDINLLIANLVFAVFWFLYYFICEAFCKGRTLGKWIIGLKVVDINGEKPRPKKIAIRTLARLNPFDIFTFFGRKWWAVDNNTGYMHDSLTKTYVVRVKKIAEYRQLEAAGQNVITQEIDLPDDNGEECADNQFKPGDKVFYAGDNRVMFVDKIMPDGNIHCIQIYANGEIESLGVYERSVLRHYI